MDLHFRGNFAPGRLVRPVGRRGRGPGAGLLFLLAFAGAARAAELSGSVELVAEGKSLNSADVRYAVVYYKPKSAAAVRPAAEPLEMAMRKKEFVPRVLAITRGSTVRFPNTDPILHNVFSVSGENQFDLGLYAQGHGKAWKFANPGVVRVYCNVHHSMVAYILVLDTPYFASPETDGKFHLAGVPEGEGTLVVWHERSEPWSAEVHVPAAAPIAARLEVTRPQVPPHLNKFGKPYKQETGLGKDYR